MTCIYVRHNVLFSNTPNTTGPPNGYTCGVKVRVQGQSDLTVVNCYTPKTCTSFYWLTELGIKGRYLVTGDFNVRDSSWERDNESSSPSLTAQTDNSDFIVLNDGSFTRIPDPLDQRPSATDLTLVTPDTASGVKWEERNGFIVVRPPAHHSQLRFLNREGDSCYYQQVQLRLGQLGLVQESSGSCRDQRRRG